jgi:hypothetical protein
MFFNVSTTTHGSHLAQVGSAWSEFYPAFDFFEYSAVGALEQSNAALQARVEINVACENVDDDIEKYGCITT